MLVAVSTVENVQKRQYSLRCVDFSKPGLRSFQMCVYFQRLMPSLPSHWSHEFRNIHVWSKDDDEELCQTLLKSVGRKSTFYVMNGTYELCFCSSLRPKALLAISEHPILRQLFPDVAVHNVLKYF